MLDGSGKFNCAAETIGLVRDVSQMNGFQFFDHFPDLLQITRDHADILAKELSTGLHPYSPKGCYHFFGQYLCTQLTTVLMKMHHR
jgi:hypothetical protein